MNTRLQMVNANDDVNLLDHLPMLGVVAALAVAWFILYVGPRDEHHLRVVECVQAQGKPTSSQATWEACDAKLIGQAGTLVQALHP